jgi:hypothetical protein
VISTERGPKRKAADIWRLLSPTPPLRNFARDEEKQSEREVDDPAEDEPDQVQWPLVRTNKWADDLVEQLL